jgi:tRNA threonylcarbamoyladenosine biosynthesis protein TsaB
VRIDMKILALDSTAATASIALCDDRNLIALVTLNNGLTHTETLLPTIDMVLKSTGTSIDDIDIFACAAGPGSFTGVRIGAATIKGLAFGRGKVCIGVSTLMALAYNLVCCDGIICPVMNARRGQVYNAVFDCRAGRLTRLTPDRAISLTELYDELEKYDDNIYICSDGYDLIEQSQKIAGLRIAPGHLLWQNAYSVAACALELYEGGQRITDAELVPTYLRMPQAERERLERFNRKEHNT